jgi:anti-sigma factor ChrR (cupin superfamily)
LRGNVRSTRSASTLLQLERCFITRDDEEQQPKAKMMNINDDFSLRVSEHAAAMSWVASPMPGVDRKMLDRIGDEVARATSIVRYAPNSAFSPHVHTGGEEFLVLDGVFQDEHGDFPAGSYVRNPPESSHTPRSEPGCTILVKLWQFDLADRHPVLLNANDHQYLQHAKRPGVSVMPLHEDARETVRLERWIANADIEVALPGGAEVFVLDGSFEEAEETFANQSWLRLPAGSTLRASAGREGAHVWIKLGHLASPQVTP